MAHGKAVRTQIVLDRQRQLQESQTIGDRAAIAADPLGELLLRPAEFGQDLLVRLGFLHRIKIFPKEILDQRQFKALRIRGLPDHGRNPVQPRLPRRSPSTLSGDELPAPRRPAPHHDRLDDARRLDREREFIEGDDVEGLSRLTWIRLDLLDRDLGERFRG